MKRLSKITLLFLLIRIAMLSLCANAAHVRTDCIVTLNFQTLQEPEQPISPNKGHRSQSQQFTMVISEESGINIGGIDKSTILAYEVYDESDEYLGKFCYEYEFADFILSQTEPVLIKIMFADFILFGWSY